MYYLATDLGLVYIYITIHYSASLYGVTYFVQDSVLYDINLSKGVCHTTWTLECLPLV